MHSFASPASGSPMHSFASPASGSPMHSFASPASSSAMRSFVPANQNEASGSGSNIFESFPTQALNETTRNAMSTSESGMNNFLNSFENVIYNIRNKFQVVQ
jgi:hypothetical protein